MNRFNPLENESLILKKDDKVLNEKIISLKSSNQTICLYFDGQQLKYRAKTHVDVHQAISLMFIKCMKNQLTSFQEKQLRQLMLNPEIKYVQGIIMGFWSKVMNLSK